MRSIVELFQDSTRLATKTLELNEDLIIAMGRLISSAFKDGNKLLICGNGGSAAQADHLAAEFLVRLDPSRDRGPLPAMSLTMDTATMTANANDYHYGKLYGRMVDAFGVPGDVLLGISTTGQSPNVHSAIIEAKSKEMVALGLLGGNGGYTAEVCDLALVVPSNQTGRIQEVHAMVCHAIAEIVEDAITNA